jgi:2-polyprenyl-3-methyl-5-hydroxy-6-metoxy-1,4-benzoquinol methylase
MNTSQNRPLQDHPFISECPVGCTAGMIDSDIVLPEGPLRRCLSCGHLVSSCSEKRYHNTMIEFEEPQGTWPSARGMRRLTRRAGQMMKICEKLLKKMRHNIRLLDVGCSSGSFVYAAESVGVQAEGVEPSANPAHTAVEHGLKVQQGFIEDLHLLDESFDVITLFEVAEHLSAPLPLFKECHRILSPGGVMIVRTGNSESWTARFMGGSWEYFDMTRHGGHISFFNPSSFELIAQRCGFKVVRLQTRKVTLYEKDILPLFLFQVVRLITNMLKPAAAWMGKGHAIQAYLKKIS